MSVLISLLELFTEVRKMVSLLDYQFIRTDATQEQPDGRDLLVGHVVWAGAQGFHVLPKLAPLLSSMGSPMWKLFKPFSLMLWGFLGRLHLIGMLNH